MLCKKHICIYLINLSQDDPKLTHFETKWPFKKSRVVVESCETSTQLDDEPNHDDHEK